MMSTTNKLLIATMAGLILSTGFAMPAFAQKTGPSTPAATATSSDMDFGDDSSEWNKDGECDDPRFQGPGSAAELVDADLLKDATDCRAAYEAGTVTLKNNGGGPVTNIDAIDFGDDASDWSRDGECDDQRLNG
jgi:hypothetical protein